MKIACLSDLHGTLPTLESGDLLLIAGDLTSNDKSENWVKFFRWLELQDYRKKIFIAGNHDNFLQHCIPFEEVIKLGFPPSEVHKGYEYLCDNSTTFEGLKIFGSPWTKTFPDINPKCKAFTKNSEFELEQIYQAIPHDTDILITHNPPYGIFDDIPDYHTGKTIYTGSPSLRHAIEEIQPKIHLFGHIHEHGGKTLTIKPQMQNRGKDTICINASIMNPRYEPDNNPIYLTI